MTRHTQVPFKTLGNGAVVEVDEGMLPILTELRRLGVKTQYSCQGDEFGGYVLADYWSFRPVLRKIKRNIRQGVYSPESQTIASALFSGMRQWTLVWFNKGRSREVKLLVRSGRKFKQGYSIEYQLDNYYGPRTTVRWPVWQLDAIGQMLVETK